MRAPLLAAALLAGCLGPPPSIPPSLPATPAPEIVVQWAAPITDPDVSATATILRGGECLRAPVNVTSFLARWVNVTLGSTIRDVPASLAVDQPGFALPPGGRAQTNATLCAGKVDRPAVGGASLDPRADVPVRGAFSSGATLCVLPANATPRDCFPASASPAPARPPPTT